MKRTRLKRVMKKGMVLSRLPADASYQGVNHRGNPLYYSAKSGMTYESLGGYGTPMFGKPRAGNRFSVIG